MRALVCLFSLLLGHASSLSVSKESNQLLGRSVMPWICDDQFLLQATTIALEASTDIDWITANLTATVKGYRSSLWAVQTSTFDRATADYLPTNQSGDDLCFVTQTSSTSSANILTIIVRVSPY